MSEDQEDQQQYYDFVDGLSTDLKKLGEFYAGNITQSQADASVVLANKVIKQFRLRSKDGKVTRSHSHMICLAAIKIACSALDAQTGAQDNQNTQQETIENVEH